VFGVCARRLTGEGPRSVPPTGVPALVDRAVGVADRFLGATSFLVVVVGEMLLTVVFGVVGAGHAAFVLAYCANDFFVSGTSGSQIIFLLITRIRLNPKNSVCKQ